MKRIARVAGEQGWDADAVVRHAELVALLRARLSPAMAALFANPKLVDGGVEWYSDLSGQPQPFTSLNATEATRIRSLLQERLDSIRQLADRLEREGGSAGQVQAALLRRAAREPDPADLYALNGQPVLTVWGPEPSPPPPAPVAEPNPVFAAANPPSVVPDKSRRRGCRWLLLASLLSALLAVLLWWLYCPWPRDLIAELEQKLAAAGEDCVALEAVKKDPLWQEIEPHLEPFRARLQQVWDQHCVKKPEPEPEPQPEPVPEPEPPPAPEPPPPPPPPPPPDPCVEARKKQTTEMVMVFDASLSMEFSMNLDPQVATDLFYSGGRDCFDPAARAQLEWAGYGYICDRLTAPPRRMSLAKAAVQTVLKSLPKDVSVGVVLIEDCPAARSIGFFSPSKRADLLSRMEAIQSVGSTPLADSVARAGAMLDGANRDAYMLVISDGEESCNGDPCAVAAQLAAAKPRLKINVVDIMNVGAGNCLARATGGKVFPATQAKQVAVRMREAVQDLIGPDCPAPAAVPP